MGEEEKIEDVLRTHPLGRSVKMMPLLVNAGLLSLLPIYMFTEIKRMSLFDNMTLFAAVAIVNTLILAYGMRQASVSNVRQLASKDRAASAAGRDNTKRKDAERQALFESIGTAQCVLLFNVVFLGLFLGCSCGAFQRFPKEYNYVMSVAFPSIILFLLTRPTSS